MSGPAEIEYEKELKFELGKTMILDNILKSIGCTPIVKLDKIGKELECNLYGK